VATQVAIAQRLSNINDSLATFGKLRANTSVGDRGCFWIAGGANELAIPVWAHFFAVMKAGG
jgi:hypothetical protein